MKSFLRLFKNPHAVMFVVAHWMLVCYLIFEKLTRKPSGFSGYYKTWQDDLSEFISVVNLPGILPAALLWSPIYFFGNWDIFYKTVIFTSIFTVTIQWLVIGQIVFNTFSKFESRMTKLSLNNE